MNKRIRKKKEKQRIARTIRELVKEADEMRQFGIAYIRYMESVRERQYGIKLIYTPLFEKEG